MNFHKKIPSIVSGNKSLHNTKTKQAGTKDIVHETEHLVTSTYDGVLKLSSSSKDLLGDISQALQKELVKSHEELHQCAATEQESSIQTKGSKYCLNSDTEVVIDYTTFDAEDTIIQPSKEFQICRPQVLSRRNNRHARSSTTCSSSSQVLRSNKIRQNESGYGSVCVEMNARQEVTEDAGKKDSSK